MSPRLHLVDGCQQDYDRTEESRGLRNLITWRKGMEIKKDYHQALYGDIKAPEPLDLGIQSILPDNQALIKIEPPTSQQSYGPRP